MSLFHIHKHKIVDVQPGRSTYEGQMTMLLKRCACGDVTTWYMVTGRLKTSRANLARPSSTDPHVDDWDDIPEHGRGGRAPWSPYLQVLRELDGHADILREQVLAACDVT